MMQGSIDAPGVYIDASAILQRQFLAFCIDNWVSSENIEQKDFPHKLYFVLTNIKIANVTAFPYTLFKYIETKIDELLENFFCLYGTKLHSSSKEKLNTIANRNSEECGLVIIILEKLEQINQEQINMSNQLSALKKKIKEFENKEAKNQDHDENLVKIKINNLRL